MKVKLIATALAAAAAVTVLLAAPAQALPPGPPSADCARYAANMAYYADMAHDARMRHDVFEWNLYQLQYENEWWKSVDAGC
jgi:hypothetical protein